MKPSTVALTTTILMAGMLICPWTEVATWETVQTGYSKPLGTSAAFRPDRSTRQQLASRIAIPYPFFYDGGHTNTKILWDETFIILGAIGLVGAGLYFRARSTPKAPAPEPKARP